MITYIKNQFKKFKSAIKDQETEENEFNENFEELARLVELYKEDKTYRKVFYQACKKVTKEISHKLYLLLALDMLIMIMIMIFLTLYIK